MVSWLCHLCCIFKPFNPSEAPFSHQHSGSSSTSCCSLSSPLLPAYGLHKAFMHTVSKSQKTVGRGREGEERATACCLDGNGGLILHTWLRQNWTGLGGWLWLLPNGGQGQKSMWKNEDCLLPSAEARGWPSICREVRPFIHFAEGWAESGKQALLGPALWVCCIHQERASLPSKAVTCGEAWLSED